MGAREQLIFLLQTTPKSTVAELRPVPHGGPELTSALPIPSIAGEKGAGCPLPKNPNHASEVRTSRFGPSGLAVPSPL